MDQNTFDDVTKLPEVQDIIMSGVIGCVAVEIAKMLNITPIDALMEFYESDTCRRLHDKSTGLYLFGEKYIAEEFVESLEKWEKSRCLVIRLVCLCPFLLVADYSLQVVCNDFRKFSCAIVA